MITCCLEGGRGTTRLLFCSKWLPSKWLLFVNKLDVVVISTWQREQMFYDAGGGSLCLEIVRGVKKEEDG